MREYILESCVDSVESALAAAKGGASRLELCGNLIIGGTTPSPGLFQEIRRYSDIRIHALIRPRFGDFCYTEHEFQIIRRDVKMFRELGAEGVVIGILKPDGSLNLEQMRILMEEADGMSVTLHRAFDVCRDPFEALEQAKELGIRTILTSGQKNSCLAGRELLKELVEKAGNDLEIMVGSGVDAEAIREIGPYTGAHVFHMSGKETLDSVMEYRKDGVNMGLPFISEFEIWRTAEEKVREAREVLNRLAEEKACF
ncbi:MAG: copper homeostasis protein CutC [Eubacteriales bacterium]|nr:copper homeostasis protein CutC [Eubacteriales bacterium]